MEGPREPGYYASVTGRRPPGERQGRPRPGEPRQGPVAIFGQVHLYGPKGLFGRQKVERVWDGKEYPTPEGLGMDRFGKLMDKAMGEAEEIAEHFNLKDPQ